MKQKTLNDSIEVQSFLFLCRANNQINLFRQN